MKTAKGGMDLKETSVYWVILAICLAFLGGWLCHDWFTASSVEVQVTQDATQLIEASLSDLGSSIIGDTETTPAININTASAEELQTLPSIGTVRAQSILDYRETNGPFTYPEELVQVDGIGEGILEEILPYIIVE